MIRPLTCVCMLLAGASGLYLYQTKHQAQMLDREIGRTQDATRTARERIGMLRAEWALLQEPERLKDLADQHLPLRTLQPGQVVQLSDLAARLPAPVAPGTVLPEETAPPVSLPMVQVPQRAPLMAAARPAMPALRPTAAPGPAAVPAPTTQMAAVRAPAPPRPPSPPRVALAAAEPTLPLPVPSPLPTPPQRVAAGAPSILQVSAPMVLPMPVPPPAPGAVLSDSAPLRPTHGVLAPVISAVATPMAAPSAQPGPRVARVGAMAAAPASGPALARARPAQAEAPMTVSVLGIAARPLLAPPVPVRPAPGQGAR